MHNGPGSPAHHGLGGPAYSGPGQPLLCSSRWTLLFGTRRHGGNFRESATEAGSAMLHCPGKHSSGAEKP
jgi:hypothetical protein